MRPNVNASLKRICPGTETCISTTKSSLKKCSVVEDQSLQTYHAVGRFKYMKYTCKTLNAFLI